MRVTRVTQYQKALGICLCNVLHDIGAVDSLIYLHVTVPVLILGRILTGVLPASYPSK